MTIEIGFGTIAAVTSNTSVQTHLLTTFMILVLSAISFILLPSVPIVSPDGESYITQARIFSGAISSVDLRDVASRFPPGYGTVLALPQVLGFSEFTAWRLVAAACLGVILFIIFTIQRSMGVTPLRSIVGTGLIVLLTGLPEISYFVVSEPLFIAVLLFHLYALQRLSANRSAAWWWPALLSLCFLPLVRILGFAILPFSALILFRREMLNPKRVAALLLTACLLLGWYLSIGLGGGRSLGFKSFSIQELLKIPDVFGMGGILIFLAALIVRSKSRISDTHPRERNDFLLSILFLSAAALLGFIVFSRLLADSEIPFNARLLSAPFILLLLWSWSIGSASSSRILVLVLAIIGLGQGAFRTLESKPMRMRDGGLFSDPALRHSQGLAWLQSNIRNDSLIHSNAPDFLRLHLLRSSSGMSGALEGVPCCDDRFIVYVKKIAWRQDQAMYSALSEKLGLPDQSYPEMDIWGKPTQNH